MSSIRWSSSPSRGTSDGRVETTSERVATRAALVPGALALLPEYPGLTDPVAELRAACLDAVAWLGPDVRVLADEQGARVASYLRSAATPAADVQGPALLVVGNGSARRTADAPGSLDERAAEFDRALRAALLTGDPSSADLSLATELWASVAGIAGLDGQLGGAAAVVDYDDAPFGVQYWVMRWTCGS